MGIEGLIQFFTNNNKNVSAIKPNHLSKLRGMKAAVDANSWLLEGLSLCAYQIFLDEPTTEYVDYCIGNLNLLQDHFVIPVLVFDGVSNPFKKRVESVRREEREKAINEANELFAWGNSKECDKQMKLSMVVTNKMVSNLIKAARNIGVESVVAPYEVNAQLVYLEQKGIVDFIISDDSDLIVFGAQKIFFKMSDTGYGEMFDVADVESCLKANKQLTRSPFEFQRFIYAAILSGCDYLQKMPRMSLTEAWQFMQLTENMKIRQFLCEIPSYMQLSDTKRDEYAKSFVMAALSFQSQIVFDTRQKHRIPLNASIKMYQKYWDKFHNRFTSTTDDHLQLALGNINYYYQYDYYDPPIESYLYR